MSLRPRNNIILLRSVVFILIFSLFSIFPFPAFPPEDEQFQFTNSSSVQYSSGKFNNARGGYTIELPGINLEDDVEIYTGEKLLITGDISLLNGSHLTFKNCEVSIESRELQGYNIDIDGTSILVMDNSTIKANGTLEGYKITCMGMLSLHRSRMEGFDTFLMLNTTGSMDSSSITIGEGTFRMNNSDLTLLNSTIDHDTILLEDSSILHFHEYLHVSVNSEYLGPVELATVSIEDGAGDLISSDMTDENGKIPVLNLELSRRYKNRTDYFGPYIINVSHSKYYGNKTTRNISSELVIDIDLKPILGIITGWVSLPDGTPVLDATLSNELVQSKTSNDGKYILSVFARTTCTMIASKEHHSKEYIPGIYVGEGMTLVLNFTLKEDESPLSVIFLESSSYKIPLNRTLIVEFPEVLDPDTVNVSTVLLFRTDGVSSIAVNRLISLGEDMRSIRISPREDLKENSWYSMILKKEIKGLNQKEVIWRDFSYQFKTDYEALMTTVPVNGAQEVMVHEPLTIELTVPIKEDTLNASTVFVMDSSGNYVNRELSMIGGNIIVLKRTANLAYDSNYTVVITPLLKDLDSQSIFSNAYSFGFRTAIEKFRPVLHINITGEEGVMLEPLAAPRINITRPGFVMDFAFEGGMILSDLLSGTYNITAYARGYENATVILFLENNYIYNQSFELKRVQEISDEGRTSVGTIIVIGVIMGMFLLSIIFLGVRRADRLVKGRTKKNIQRSGAPGMESFEYKLAPELSVSELPAREEADGGKEPKGKGTRSSHR